MRFLIGNGCDTGFHIAFLGWDQWVIGIGHRGFYPISKHIIFLAIGPIHVAYDWGNV